MPRWTASISACLALLLAAPAVESRAGDEVDAAADRKGVSAVLAWEGRAVCERRARPIRLGHSPPAGVLPPPTARAPRYGTVALPGGASLLFAADAALGEERVWVDGDLDGRLDDETPLAWSRAGVRSTVAVVVHVPRPGASASPAGVPIGVPVGVRLSRAPFRRELTVSARVGCQRWGAVPLAGALRQVALEDGDGDLRFDGDADRVFVDLDGDGTFDTSAGSPEALVPGSTVRLGSLEYVAAVGGSGGDALHFAVPRAGGAAPASVGERPAEPLELLVRAIEDPATGTIEERAVLVARMGASDTAASHEYLVRLVRSDRDPRLRAAALDGLARGSCAQTRQLLEDELGRSPIVARRAAHHLMALGTDEARAAIVRHLRGLPAAALRLAVYQGAREAPGPVPGKAMLVAARDVHGPLRALGLRDLQAARDDRVRSLALQAADGPAHADVVRCLPSILAAAGDAECVDALFALALESGARDAVIEAVGSLPDGAGLRRVAAHLQDGHAEVRALAAEALVGAPAPHVSGALLDALGSEADDDVRIVLLDVLGERGEVRAVEVLEELGVAGSRQTRAAAFEALGAPGLRGLARPFLDRALHGPLRGNRVAAACAVASSGDVELLPRVRQVLCDEYRLARLAAAEALGVLRHRDSVRPLIDRLEEEPNPRLRSAVAESLFRITGVNLYDDVALWERWWTEQGATFTVPVRTPVLPDADRGSTHASPPPRFYGIPIESDGVVFVIDQSGSMGAGPTVLGYAADRGEPAKFDVAVKELLGAVDALHAGAGVNVVLFESTVRSWARSLQPLTPRVREVLKEFLESQKPTGATNLFDALQKAILMDDVETVVVLSDGAPTAGRIVEEASILAAVERLNERREIVIHCVSVGGPSRLLRRLAADNGGRYARR